METSNFLRASSCSKRELCEPFGIVVVYLQKRDFEKNDCKDFRHFRTRNLTQTPKKLDALYEVVAYLVKLCIKSIVDFNQSINQS